MLKQPAHFVLATLNASTYEKVCLSTSLAAPRWTVFLNILQALIEGTHSRQDLVVKTRATSRSCGGQVSKRAFIMAITYREIQVRSVFMTATELIEWWITRLE